MSDPDYTEQRTYEQIALDYARAAKTCVDEGYDSSACQKELISEGAKQIALAYGVDPDVAAAAEECLASGDSEVCAKASAKLAATAACTIATEGAGGPLCAKLAPFVVDAIWPVVGPPLVAAWDVAWGFHEGITGGIADFASGVLKAAGIDLSTNASPTVTDVYWDMLAVGKKTILPQWEASIQAVQLAEFESRKELGLPILLPVSGDPIFPDSVGVVGGETEDIAAKYKAEAVAELEQWLRVQPEWMQPVWVLIDAKWQGTVLDYTFEVRVNPEKPPMNKEYDLVLWVGQMPEGMRKLTVGTPTYEEGEGWTPYNFAYRRFSNERRVLSEAYVATLAVRLDGLKNATTNAVGAVVARNTALADEKRKGEMMRTLVRLKRPGSSLTVPLVTGAAVVAGFLGYRYWRKVK